MPTSTNSLDKFGPRWNCHHFFSKLEFWAEICFGELSCKANRLYGVFESFKAQKWIKNSQKLSIGSCIIFPQIWNFKLKIFLVGPLMKKIGSMWFLNPLKPQNKSKMAKNCQLTATVIDSFWQFSIHFWALKDLKTT